MAVLITKCGVRTCGAGASGPGRRARAGSRTIVLALGASLCSCSVAQKADVFDWFGSDKPAADQSQPLSTDEPYPNLADVPGRPVRPPAIDRDKIAQGLVADRENAQYTEDVVRRTPEVPPRSAPAARPAAAPPPVTPPPPAPPVQTSSLPPQPPPVPPSAPPAQTSSLPPPAPPVPAVPPQAAPPTPVVETPPPSAYARPADVPVDRNAPPVQMVNNQPVVSPGFYGTEAPPSPPTPAAPLPPSSLDPLQRAVALPPPAPSTSAAAAKPSPVAVARSENVAVRPTEAPAELPPPAPRDVAPIPPAPSALPTSPPPATPPMVASLPPPPVGAPPDRLDEALRQTFPDSGRRMGIDALAATIYFAEGSANLTDEDRGILREVGRLYRERGGGARVVGYASSDGRSADLVTRRLANLDIAVRRADAVSRELARHGVPAGSITTSAEGAPAGLGTAGGGFGPAGERRVDIYLDY